MRYMRARQIPYECCVRLELNEPIGGTSALPLLLKVRDAMGRPPAIWEAQRVRLRLFHQPTVEFHKHAAAPGVLRFADQLHAKGS